MIPPTIELETATYHHYHDDKNGRPVFMNTPYHRMQAARGDLRGSTDRPI